MEYGSFIRRVIDDGIEAVKVDYAHKPLQRDGALRGFEECRGLLAPDLKSLLVEANERCIQAHREQAADYWYWRCRAAEIEWVANVVSAAFMNSGLPIIVTPTCRGMMKAAEILGVKDAV